MAKKEDKTNVMRILDQKKIEYNHYIYECDAALSGDEIATKLGQNPDHVFKTLVTTNGKNSYFVFMIPVNRELDLKKAAKAANEKSIEMIKSKDLLGLTGYIHGGCSPIGMKKLFPTTCDESAQLYETIIFSGGRIGCQVEMPASVLETVVPIKYADLCKNND